MTDPVKCCTPANFSYCEVVLSPRCRQGQTWTFMRDLSLIFLWLVVRDVLGHITSASLITITSLLLCPPLFQKEGINGGGEEWGMSFKVKSSARKGRIKKTSQRKSRGNDLRRHSCDQAASAWRSNQCDWIAPSAHFIRMTGLLMLPCPLLLAASLLPLFFCCVFLCIRVGTKMRLMQSDKTSEV